MSVVSDIKKCLVKFNLTETKDYRLSQLAEPVPQGGYSRKNIYHLTPRSFKLCLMRSHNTVKYCEYYILLEECIYYFNKYQLQLSSENNIILEKKCADYEDTIAESKRMMNTLLERQEEDRIRQEENRANQDEINAILMARYRQEHREKEDAEAHVQDIIPDRVIRPEEQEKCGSFVLMKLQQNKFRAIRCQKRTVHSAIKKVDANFPGATVWMRIDYHPNPVKFWNVIKSRVDFVAIHRNNLELMNATEDDLREAIQELEQERLQ